MNTLKKIYALLLTMVLVLSLLPMGAFALESGNTEDKLVYNCGTAEVVVGWNVIDSGKGQDAFQADGSYCIQLEDNAFFPYEVQFQYDGKTTVESFSDLDSTVQVGTHRIGVISNYTEDAIAQIGVYVAGTYIPAMPDAKTFFTDSKKGGRSLLPLDRKQATLDLTAYTPEELKSVAIDVVKGPLNGDAAGKTILWDYVADRAGNVPNQENFTPIGTDPVDLSRIFNRQSITMIVGSGHQLDNKALRYMVLVKRNDQPRIDLQLYQEDAAGAYEQVAAYPSQSSKNGIVNYTFYLEPQYSTASDYALQIRKSNSSDTITMKMYQGHFDTVEEAQAAPVADITGKISVIGEYQANFQTVQPFTVIYQLNGKLVQLQKFTVIAKQQTPSDSEMYFEGLYVEDTLNAGRRQYAGFGDTSTDPLTGINTVLVSLSDAKYIPEASYYAGFSYFSNDEIDNGKVTKAVLGHYDSLEAASAQPDIKDQLLADQFYEEGGYRAVYKDGVKFTLFAEGQIYKYTVIAVPNPGSSDTYFKITGIQDNASTKSVYTVVDKDDSGARQFGYKVLMLDDAAALSNLKPVFTTFSGIDVFVNGEKQVSGVSEQDFSKGPVQYTARAENGTDVKNYWVSFTAKTTGAKLFVVVDGQKPDEREIFFDNYTDNHHDIFLANIGDAPLNGLKVELKDAVNIKLDAYWIVGGDGNDTLPVFDPTITTGAGDERSNIAKVRLVPTGEGAVSGSLVISSANGGRQILALKGTAGNPKIITEALSPAVKYVPYSFLIQTDNKYAWNRVTFQTYDDLPEGMVLRPSGELYGVPVKAGDYTFKVRASYSASDFRDSEKTFTLTVRENTTENVAAQVDTNYRVLDAVPNMNSAKEQLFRSEGSFVEFIDFWIDGNKMVRGVDYTAKDGSTAITIVSQTFQTYGNGTHTIAAEFRVGGDKDNSLKKTAQNYTLGGGAGGNTGDNTGGNTGGGNSGSGSLISGGNTGNTGNNRQSVADQAKQALSTALPNLVTRLKNMDFIKLTEFQDIVAVATQVGKTPWLHVDSMLPGTNTVDIRVSIDPSLAKEGLSLAGSSTSQQAKRTKSQFEKFFSNQICKIVSLSHKGTFGQTVSICVSLPQGTDVQSLMLYSYDVVTNQYTQIVNPGCWVDINSYLHFDTQLGGDIVISKGVLTLKS